MEKTGRTGGAVTCPELKGFSRPFCAASAALQQLSRRISLEFALDILSVDEIDPEVQNRWGREYLTHVLPRGGSDTFTEGVDVKGDEFPDRQCTYGNPFARFSRDTDGGHVLVVIFPFDAGPPFHAGTVPRGICRLLARVRDGFRGSATAICPGGFAWRAGTGGRDGGYYWNVWGEIQVFLPAERSQAGTISVSQLPSCAATRPRTARPT